VHQSKVPLLKRLTDTGEDPGKDQCFRSPFICNDGASKSCKMNRATPSSLRKRKSKRSSAAFREEQIAPRSTSRLFAAH